MRKVMITASRQEEFARFLELHDFVVEDVGNELYRIRRDQELPVFVKIAGSNMYFEVDLGNVSAIASQDFYFRLLDLNTEILPVSFGINNANPDDPHLVLVESRETGDLSDNELLTVFSALELAVDKAEALLSAYMGEVKR